MTNDPAGNFCVVHLVWGPLGLDPFRAFLDSYRQHPAGIPHRLLVVFNGLSSPAEETPYRELLDGLEHSTLSLSQPVQDIAAYLHAAETCAERWLCFLNSYSFVLAADWLRKLAAPLGGSGGVRLVGATGSWESYYSSMRRYHQLDAPPRWWTPHGIRTHLRRGWDEWAALRRFPRFPNPHLRTNAFLVDAALLRAWHPDGIRTKSAALLFESGRRGLTAHAARAGSSPCLVDRTGRVWERDDWAVSRIFRSGNQENLLVSDNRTRQYEQGSPAERRVLSLGAWGMEEPV